MTSLDHSIPLLDQPLSALLARAGVAPYSLEQAELRVALLGGTTTQFLARLLPLFLEEAGVRAVVYETPFGSLVESVLNPASELYAFAPQVTIVLPGVREIGVQPTLLASQEEVTARVQQQSALLESYWEVLIARSRTHVIQANFPLPAQRPLGNLEASVPYAELAYVRALNASLASHLRPSVSLFDLEYLVSQFGIARAFDLRTYYLTKQAFSFDFLPVLSHALARQIALHTGRSRKCAVLDLDGTLWGGTVGDDGIDGIVLGPDSPEGEAFSDFQRYLKRLKERGVLLAVCSKNDEQVAREVFRKHPHMQISSEDIACFVANWEDKASNVLSIARTLNIGLDALVFIDNSAEERHIIRTALPEVWVVELPEDPSDYLASIDRLSLFEVAEVSAEATQRTASFSHERQRAEIERGAVDYDAYLRSLALVAQITPIDGANMARVCELVKRTNQFNLRTQRHTEQEVYDLARRPENVAFCVSLGDRFGHHGIISVLIAEARGQDLFIDTWLMSCRVLKRGVEALVLERLVAEARARGVSRLMGEYRPSEKNSMVRDLLPSLGFVAIEAGAAAVMFELELTHDLVLTEHFIAEKGSSKP